MANYDFITSTLNVSQDSIESISTHRINDVFHIYVKLKPIYPECPFCGGPSKI